MKNKNLYLQFSNLQERMYSTGEDHIELEARKILENIAWHYESGQA
jgi:hypothetical protein